MLTAPIPMIQPVAGSIPLHPKPYGLVPDVGVRGKQSLVNLLVVLERFNNCAKNNNHQCGATTMSESSESAACGG
jgi:hypothetical protein